MVDSLDAARSDLDALIQTCQHAHDSAAPAERGYIAEASGLLDRVKRHLERASTSRHKRAMAQ